MGLPAGNSNLVRAIGPGEIFMALTTVTTLPVEIPTGTFSLDTDLKSVGFTRGGSSLEIKNERIDINVAERLRPVRYKPGTSGAVLSFEMVEVSPANLVRAIPGATTSLTTSGDTKIVMPKNPGNVRYTVVWVSSDDLVMCVLSRCYVSMSGAIVNGEQTSGDPSGLMIECAIEDAGVGVDDLYWIYDSSLVTA